MPAVTDTVRPVSGDDVTTRTPISSDLSDDAVIFDGLETFGDDQILDFTIKIDNTEFAQDAKVSNMSTSADDAIVSIYGIDDWGGFAIIDFAGCISPEPQMMNDDFDAPVHQLSATDAVPLI